MTTSGLSVEFILRQLETFPNDAGVMLCGYSGPQGSGKTFNCQRICDELNKMGVKSVQFSMDDFYLTHKDQLQLQKQYPHDWMLSGRGLPGTHDLPLLKRVLNAIRSRNESVNIPTYDKSQHQGKGDRLEDGWIEIDCSDLQVVLFEGWFNGYVHIPSEEMLLDKWAVIASKFPKVKEEDVVRLNTNLELYFDIWRLFDCFICVRTDSIENVYKWRQQQELALIKQRGVGMSETEVKTFVDRYMPVYGLYFSRLELMVNMVPSLELEINLDRQLVN